jgi:putative acetyltransferase
MNPTNSRAELPAHPSLTLRAAVDADAEGLIALIGDVFAAYAGCVLDVDAEEPDLKAVATAYTRRGGTFWVATDSALSEHVVGSVGWAPTDAASVIELRKLYVAIDYRRRGLGRSLLGLVEAVAEQRQAAAIELWTDTRFIEGHEFYRAHGFVQLPETRRLHDLSDTTEYHFSKSMTSVRSGRSRGGPTNGQSPL